jgi:hypothetical protein
MSSIWFALPNLRAGAAVLTVPIACQQQTAFLVPPKEHGLDFITDGEDLREFDVAFKGELATGDDTGR